MNKTIALLLAFVLVLTLAACGGGTKEEPEKGTTVTTEKKTLKMLVADQGNWTYNKDKPIWKAIADKTNVTIEGQVPPGENYTEALNLTIASGNMPDLMFMGDFSIANKYGGQGALVNILEYVDSMPNFKKWLGTYPELKERYLSSDGKMYMFPNQGFGETNRITWLYREDVFKKNNLKAPQNYDELYTALKQLKQLYPDSYPLVTRFGFGTVTRSAPNFETGNGPYYDFDKKEWRYGPTEDNYKKLITYLNRFYKEGLIPPDWLTVNTKKFEDFISNNKTFVLLDYMVMDTYNLPLRKDNPQFNLMLMAPPSGFAGAKQVNPNENFVDSGMTVASTSTKIKDVMKYMDFFYSEAGRELSSWGVEGVTYEVKDGKKKFLDEFKTLAQLREKPGLLNFGTYTWIDYSTNLSIATQETRDAFKDVAKYDSKLQPKPAFTDKEQDIINTVGQAITKHREENITKFILGDKRMEDWDQYVSEVKKLGVDQLLSVYKDAYNRVLKAK